MAHWLLAYGQERAQLQGLVPLAVAMCWLLQQLAGARGWRNIPLYQTAVAALAVVFVNTTYLVGAALGGVTSVNLSNSGAAYEYFYTTAPETSFGPVAGKPWFNQGSSSTLMNTVRSRCPLSLVYSKDCFPT